MKYTDQLIKSRKPRHFLHLFVHHLIVMSQCTSRQVKHNLYWDQDGTTGYENVTQNEVKTQEKAEETSYEEHCFLLFVVYLMILSAA